jgi:hypothetical protein
LRFHPQNAMALLLVPGLVLVAGCGGRVSAFSGLSDNTVAIHAAATHIDTNGTTRYSATLANGKPARVEWSVSGGDPSAGPGRITPEGLYIPPTYLTQDDVTVSVNAVLTGTGAGTGSMTPTGTASLTVTPGFLQPLTPGNLSLGAGGSVTISGSMTEVGGSGGIRFTLASDVAGTPSASGTISSPHCVRGSVSGSNPAYTVCSVTYTAPAVIPASGSVFIVGSVASSVTSSPTLSWTRVLLNADGISSNPAGHQAHLAVPVQLGSSSGNNSDYDSTQGKLSDCCGGTLGALLQDTSGNQYVLSNNHVLARSDQSIPGETVIQPGLIDNGCTPYGLGPGATPVATLTGYPSLSSVTTNVDAAIARVTLGAVDSKGSILELGAKQPDGTLGAAPPGISSTGGKGETASLGMMVAKSGRTTGLTCAAVSAVSVDVMVDYFTDCAETTRSMTKTFTNQIAIAGTSFSDAGDSGALVVDTANAEPVGLFFAGGTDGSGVEHAIANPVADVLATLDSQVQGTNGQTTYGFVGGADHPVSCLRYGGTKAVDEAVSASRLSSEERARVEAALPLAQASLNPAAGLNRVGVAASKDHPGEGAIAFYVESGTNVPLGIPSSVGGIPTVVLIAPAQSGDSAAPATAPPVSTLQGAILNQAIAAKQRNAEALFKSNPAIFGVGVGQSLDSPADAALVLYVDRKKMTGTLPEFVEGQRVRVILMDRLHVTRSHGSPAHTASSCSESLRGGSSEAIRQDPAEGVEPDFQPFEDKLQLPE